MEILKIHFTVDYFIFNLVFPATFRQFVLIKSWHFHHYWPVDFLDLHVQASCGKAPFRGLGHLALGFGISCVVCTYHAVMVLSDWTSCFLSWTMEGPERRIRNLLSIKGLEDNSTNLLKVALEEWQSSAEVFGKRVDKRQKEVRNIVNEIYQVVGFYSAFQGLLLTAVAQSNLLHCNNLGFPLALSALATFVALVGIGQKSWNILQFNRLIRSEDPTRRVCLWLQSMISLFYFLQYWTPWCLLQWVLKFNRLSISDVRCNLLGSWCTSRSRIDVESVAEIILYDFMN